MAVVNASFCNGVQRYDDFLNWENFRALFSHFFVNQWFFQNDGVKMTRTVKISRRPMSINAESSHLTNAGRMLHDIVGPISRPSVGPTLLPQLNAMVMELVLSTPARIMMK